jgi:hypothetical protein
MPPKKSPSSWVSVLEAFIKAFPFDTCFRAIISLATLATLLVSWRTQSLVDGVATKFNDLTATSSKAEGVIKGAAQEEKREAASRPVNEDTR